MPHAFAADEPALWLPARSPTIVAIDNAPPGYDDAGPIDLASWPLKLADRTLSSGRHMVLGDVDGHHRIWLRAADLGGALAYVIVRDAAIDLRCAAMRRLDRRLAGARPMRLPPGFQPSDFQRRRLSLLLDILDAVGPRGRAAITTHEVARRFVYPGMTVGQGAEWKTSSQRRRTLRLIDEARTMMKSGYLKLLAGWCAGATKTARSK